MVGSHPTKSDIRKYSSYCRDGVNESAGRWTFFEKNSPSVLDLADLESTVKRSQKPPQPGTTKKNTWLHQHRHRHPSQFTSSRIFNREKKYPLWVRAADPLAIEASAAYWSRLRGCRGDGRRDPTHASGVARAFCYSSYREPSTPAGWVFNNLNSWHVITDSWIIQVSVFFTMEAS